MSSISDHMTSVEYTASESLHEEDWDLPSQSSSTTRSRASTYGFELDDEDLDPESAAMMEELMNMFAEVDLEGALEELEGQIELATEDENAFFGFTDMDILDVLGEGGALKHDERPDFEFMVSPPCDIRPMGTSTTTNVSEKLFKKAQAQRFPAQLVFDKNNGQVVVQSLPDGPRTVVGIIKRDDCKPLYLPMKQIDPFDLASKASESAPIKGTGLGFSSFFHLSAIIAIAKAHVSSIIEPAEGHDLTIRGMRVEVTGMGFEQRETHAHVVVNKYLLLDALYSDCADYDIYRKLSLGEDRRDTSGFLRSSFAQPPSPYTKVADRLYDVTPKITGRMRDQLFRQFKHWLSTRKPLRETLKITPIDPKIMMNKLRSGAKHGMVPAPFRVLGSSNPGLNPTVLERYEMKPIMSGDPNIRWTYRTRSPEFDPTDTLMETTSPISGPVTLPDGFHSEFFRFLLRYKVFQSAYIESELLGKITGPYGYFYSVYSHIGVAWQRTSSTSLTYYVSFYRFTEPGPIDEVGRWEQTYDERIGATVYRSPCFKASETDLHFATSYVYKAFTSICSAIPYIKPKKRLQVIGRMMCIFAIQKCSSWFSTSVAKDCRYFTLCAIAESGDIGGMAMKALDKIHPGTASFSVYYYLYRVIDFFKHRHGSKLETTPLFGLPMRFLSMEKDITQGMQWHIRTRDHDTNCMTKLLDAAIQEQATRQITLDYMVRQADFLEKMVNVGVTQDEFNDIMDSKPSHPVYNHVLFIGLAQAACEDLKATAGKRQMATGFSIHGMITDHKMATVNSPGVLDEHTEVGNTLVADGITKLLSENGWPSGVHQLIARMYRDEQRLNMYAIHAKDAKHADREIAQMMPYMRPGQYFTESMCEIYSEAEEMDMMRDPAKFSLYVNNAAEICSRGGALRSEDKSFFCGGMHPELMGLAYLSVGISVGSTSLVGAAAMQRVDRQRYVILPVHADQSVVPADVPSVNIKRRDRTKVSPVKAVKLHTHMMQGIKALGAALINTTLMKGLDRAQRELMPCIERSFIATTSDDSIRGIIIDERAEFNNNSITSEYMQRGPEIALHCMMKDSADKEILSDKLAEFNNLACGPKGAFPQSFCHAWLVVQPLLAMNPARDMLESQALARSSLSWGDSLDLAKAAAWSALVMLRQKWLFTEQDIDIARSIGLLPRNDEEFVSGIVPRGDTAISNLYNILDPERRDMVDEGSASITAAVAKFNIKPGKKLKRPKEFKAGGPFRIRRSLKQIWISRLMRGRLAAAYTRNIKPSIRADQTSKFRDQVLLAGGQLDAGKLATIREMNSTPKVLIEYLRPRKKYLLPTYQGSTTRPLDPVDMKLVLVARETGLRFNRFENADEGRLIRMDDDLFEIEYTKYERREVVKGFGFKSSTGLPLSLVVGNSLCMEPKCFRYQVELPEIRAQRRDFTVAGVQYTDVQPCMVGHQTLVEASKKKCLIAFAYVRGQREITYFYQPSYSGHVHVGVANEVPSRAVPYVMCTNGSDRILVMLRNDLTPISVDGAGYSAGVDPRWFGMSGVHASPTAAANYGDYIRSNAEGAAQTMNTIFRNLGSLRPTQFRFILHNYPRYYPGSTTITAGRSTVLRGEYSVKKLRLDIPELSDRPETCVYVDVTGDTPTRVQPVEMQALYADDDQF